MTLALSFKAADSKSTMIFTWHSGEIVKQYNGKPWGRFQLPEPPQSVVAFEAICRQRFMLGVKWQCTALVGVAA